MITRKMVFVFMIVCALMLINCKGATSVSYDESRINTILYNIEQAFDNHDVDALMTYFHIDYLHKGQARWRIREVWLDRMAEFQLIDFLNVDITVNDDNATVGFTMKLINADISIYSDEPETNGDLSYFFYDQGDWFVYGNQLNY